MDNTNTRKTKLDEFFFTKEDLLEAAKNLIERHDLDEHEYSGKITPDIIAWVIRSKFEKYIDDALDYPEEYFSFDSRGALKIYERLKEEGFHDIKD